MASLTDPAGQDSHSKMRDMRWSHAEKTIARKAFNQALDREFEVVIRQAKQMAERIEQPSDLWELEDYLTHSRKKIDRRYDYRYSVLPLVFGNLVREGRLSEEELHGLAEDKLAHIRSYAELCSWLDAVA
jgi:hypothetical protein